MTKLRRVLLISLLSWGVTFSAFAAPHQQCWKEEGFSSPAAFQAAVQDWKTRKPQMPNPIEIVRGLLALKKIEAQAEQVQLHQQAEHAATSLEAKTADLRQVEASVETIRQMALTV